MAAPSPPSLLLLPAAPSPPTPAALQIAYRAPLSAAISKARSPTSAATLVVAVACPVLGGSPSSRERPVRWPASQSLLAGLYSLASLLCARQRIPVDVGAGPGGVDLRILLVDHEPGRTYRANELTREYPVGGSTVLDLAAFASHVRPWHTVYHPSSEPGYELLSTFLKLAEGKQSFLQNQLVAVDGGLNVNVATELDATLSTAIRGLDAVIIGGTFDHLHPGHKLLLHASVLLLTAPPADAGRSSTFIIGITGDALLVNKKYAEELQPWEDRARNVVSFLATLLDYETTASSPPVESKPGELTATMRGGAVTVRCVEIQDVFGPTITEKDIDAIIVSAETRSGGKAVNDKRIEKGWHPLDVYEIDVLDAAELVGDDEEQQQQQQDAANREDFSTKISSTAIRQQRAEARRKL